jgi:membrane-associated phospholipid phosphatase
VSWRKWTTFRAVVPTLALAAFVAEAASLSALQWQDASVAGWFAALRGCDSADAAALLTRAAPYGAVAFLVAGLTLAWTRRARPRDVAWTTAMLTFGLVLASVLKILLERSRPGMPPWARVTDSFPSGHVMNAALLVGASCMMVPRRAGRPDWLRVALAIGGAVFVTGVLASRLYLGRHWPSDVVGSVLLSVWVLGLMTVHGARPRGIVAVGATAVVVGLWLTALTGTRIDLPSPSAPARAPTFRVALAHAEARGRVGLDGVWVGASTRGAHGFLRVSTPEARVVATLPRGHGTLLRIVARRGRRLWPARCAAVDLLVDGSLVGSQPVSRRWRSHAFALPTLAPGSHEFRLRARPCDPGTGTPVLALRGVELG